MLKPLKCRIVVECENGEEVTFHLTEAKFEVDNVWLGSRATLTGIIGQTDTVTPLNDREILTAFRKAGLSEGIEVEVAPHAPQGEPRK